MTDWYMAMQIFVSGIAGVFIVLSFLQLSVNLFAKIVNLLLTKKVEEQ